jgi:hypothetical protein
MAECRLSVLVVEAEHAGRASGRFAQKRKKKEHGFRNAESALHSKYLIYDHCGKADQVQDEKIQYEHCSCIHEDLLSEIPEVYCIGFSLDMQVEFGGRI